ncbi:MAG TPA: TadE/TadG family type IV pilus assembly protein [Rhizomicrobium sp.]|nr:TadE/TadG family type IV pilus assembly protein [Rhizomicrobium sp.]
MAISFKNFRVKALLERLRADARGSAALEFAMVAPVFFLLLMGTVEAGVIFFAQSSLQSAVNDTARLIRTGQSACFSLDSNNLCKTMTTDQFRTKVCSEVGSLLQKCNVDTNGNSNLQFDVTDYPAGFAGVTISSPLNAQRNLPKLTTFNTGSPCDVVLVRAYYQWPVITPLLNFFLANMNGSYHLLATAAAFRNEPYTTTTGGC